MGITFNSNRKKKRFSLLNFPRADILLYCIELLLLLLPSLQNLMLIVLDILGLLLIVYADWDE